MELDGRSVLRGLSRWQLQSPHHVRSLARRTTKIEEGYIILIIAGASATLISVVVGIVWLKRRRMQKQAVKYQQALGDDNVEAQTSSLQLSTAHANDAGSSSGNVNPAAAAAAAAATTETGNAAASVDRNASVRSVITLPAYRQMASHSEQVLGREGERDGIDTIVDLPTEEEQEALRDEEMEAMYQIRVARRQQIEEQQHRRVERREARRRGDAAALASIRARTQAATATSNPIEQLRREMDRVKERRNRSVTSVSYADLGVARHDGTRIRANSNDSERVGLLADVAGGGGAGELARPQMHQREPSVGSVLSVDSDFPSPRQSQSHSGAGSQGNRAGSSPELVEADLGEELIPPPEYEDISLDDDGSIRTRPSLNEPPPDYSGPYRLASQRSSARNTEAEDAEDAEDVSPSRLGSRAIPRLPSLRIDRLPEIVIEPSSALSHNHSRDALGAER